MREVLLTNGLAVQVDDQDVSAVSGYNWYAYKSGKNTYATRSIYLPVKQSIAMHRFIMRAEAGQVIDHIDGDGLNNCRSNLRICTRQENLRNQRKRAGCSSRFKGVSRYPSASSPWQSVIVFNYKNITLGKFRTEEEAARAYDEAALRLFGSFGRLNFPAAVSTQ